LSDHKLGEEIKIGLPIALVVNDEADYKAFLELSPSEYPQLENVTPASPPAATPPAPSTAPATPAVAPAAPTNRIPGTLSPAARHLVESKSLDVSSVIGSYKGGRIITKEDVLNGIKSGKAIPRSAPPAAPSAQASVPTPSTLSPSSTPSPAPSSTSSVASSIGGTFTDVPNNNMRKVCSCLSPLTSLCSHISLLPPVFR
jgi:pyruvate/2-oxoglutarate dehydrogenase complex dihydrolipoamide acyltransferase (E2) component